MTFSPKAIEAAVNAWHSQEGPTDRQQQSATQAALTAALAVDGGALQGWRPIESAPGEQPVDILCQDTEGEHHRFCDATIIDREPHAFTLEDTNGKHTYFPHENGMWPTHWQPPPPPAASDREERR